MKNEKYKQLKNIRNEVADHLSMKGQATFSYLIDDQKSLDFFISHIKKKLAKGEKIYVEYIFLND